MTAAPPIPVLPFVPADDPVLPLPPRAEMERAWLEHPREFADYLTKRQREIELRTSDRFAHGYEPAIWALADDLLVRGRRVVLIDPRDDTPHEIMGGSELYISGGNRSSKSEFAAKRLVRKMVEKNWGRVWAFHTTGPSSTAMQQPRVWEYIPREWKALQKSKHKLADIKYSPKNGFAGATPSFVGPNGSQCWFKNYAQSIDTVEGEELDICWMDELMPLDWIDAVRFRLATRNGVLILTFTAIHGYTATVKTLVDKARDVLTEDAKLLPIRDEFGRETGRYEQVPRVQQAGYDDMKIVYFHIFDNPFGNIEEVVTKAKARGREGILLRCYGVPTKQIGAMFPTFRRDVHVITRAQFKALAPAGTDYHYADPCSGRNWFMLWARALPDDRTIVVYREWPSPGSYIQGVGDPGDWAEPDGDKPDGKRGQAQKPWGFGHERICEEILRAEGWRGEEIETALRTGNMRAPVVPRPDSKTPEDIWLRYIDPRYGEAPTLTRYETKTLIDAMDELGMHFEPAPGKSIRAGLEGDDAIDGVHDLLAYDSEKPIGPDNKPKLVVVENCVNVIWALENWTGMDGKHGASKDPIDLLRYLALSAPQYLDDEILSVKGGGAY